MPVDPDPEEDFTICCLDVIAGESQTAATPLSTLVLSLWTPSQSGTSTHAALTSLLVRLAACNHIAAVILMAGMASIPQKCKL